MCFKLYVISFLCVTGVLLHNVSAIPKHEANIGKIYVDKADFTQSYFNGSKTHELDPESTPTKDRLQRLGYTTGYGTLNSYPGGTGVSNYNPIKLDLGGVVLGTLVGIGAIIIIPKILSAFHGGFAGYGRSEHDNDFSSLSLFLNKIDEVLGQNNIDSTSCMQRAVCSFVRSTEYNMKNGTADQMDHLIHILTENSLVEYMLDGSAIKEALERGKNNKSNSCEDLYTNCSVDTKKIPRILKNLLTKEHEASDVQI